MQQKQRRNPEWIRSETIAALAADDDLFELLVFKGGNALAHVHGLGLRASLDLDYSLAREAENENKLGDQLRRALERHFRPLGLAVFDWSFEKKPSQPREGQDESWGGFLGCFKIIETELYVEADGDLETIRRKSLGVETGGQAKRKFRIELSRNEYTEGAEEREIDSGLSIRVYTPAMIAVEKLRSLCQQMEEYEHRAKPTPRGRDFYDIHAVVSESEVNLTSEDNRELLRAVFKVKDVPLRLLGMLENYREFHRQEWEKVIVTIPEGRPKEFEYYADYVLRLVDRLESFWVKDAP